MEPTSYRDDVSAWVHAKVAAGADRAALYERLPGLLNAAQQSLREAFPGEPVLEVDSDDATRVVYEYRKDFFQILDGLLP
jgi:hypothetical protein